MTKRQTLIVVVGLVIMLGLAFVLMNVLTGMKPEPPRKNDDVLKRYVKTRPVEYTVIESSVKAPGRVLASNDVMLVAEASGRIEAGDVPLKKGASFKKGQLLLTIYKDEAEMLLKVRKSKFINIIANLLPDVKIDYPDYYDTFRNFFGSIKLDQDLPALPTENRDIPEQLRIFLASRNVLGEYFSIKKDEMALKRYSLYAPFTGTISQVNFEVGAYVNMGTQLARMFSTENLEIEVPVENGFSDWIKVGDVVEVLSESRQVKWNGRVVRKADFIEYSTQSRSVFVRVNPSDHEDILNGEYLSVDFNGHTIEGAMEMPRSAVFNSNEVFVVQDGRLMKSEIDIIKKGEESVIFRGLEPGAELVIEPLINVKEKTQVEIIR